MKTDDVNKNPGQYRSPGPDERRPGSAPDRDKDKKGSGKNFFLVLLAICTLGAGYYAFDQHRENEALRSEATFDRTQLQGDVMESYLQIEKNLSEISAHEGVLRSNIMNSRVNEGPLGPQDRVQQEIAIIQALIAHNNELIENLSNQVDDKDRQLAAYNRNVSDLNKRLKRYQTDADQLEAENALLTDNLRSVEERNTQLNDEIRLKTSEIDRQMYELDQQQNIIMAQNASLIEQEDEMHTVFYAVGSYSDLKDADIVEKEGGVIGIGTSKMLKDDFDRDGFTQIDSRDYTIIPIYSKRAELVTTHPRNSYEWVEDDQGISWIRIKNPDRFWESSKYLVVVTRDGTDFSVAQDNSDRLK